MCITYTLAGNRCCTQVGNWGRFNEEAAHKYVSRVTGNQERWLKCSKLARWRSHYYPQDWRLRRGKVGQNPEIVAVVVAECFLTGAVVLVEKLTSTYNDPSQRKPGNKYPDFTLFSSPVSASASHLCETTRSQMAKGAMGEVQPVQPPRVEADGRKAEGGFGWYNESVQYCSFFLSPPNLHSPVWHSSKINVFSMPGTTKFHELPYRLSDVNTWKIKC